MDTNTALSRRHVLGAAGLAGAGLLAVGRTPIASFLGGDASAATACASLTPVKTIGPYFVDEKLNRSDIRTDPSTGAVTAGVPLRLALTLLDEDDGCAADSGAQVDIWHASPGGLYSDESVEGTAGKQYLRGYQVSDANGAIAFTTVYPGWYSGRTVHIHFRIRRFDAAGNATYDLTTQLFFDDSLTDTVYAANALYGTRGTRDTRNAADSIYGSDGSQLLLSMTGDGSGGYVGTFSFGLSQSNQGGTTSSGPGGTPPTSGSTATATSPSSTTTSAGSTSTGSSSPSSSGTVDAASTARDTSVAAALAAVSCTRSALGARTVHARLRTQEAVTVDLRLRRGSKVVAHRRVSNVATGAHTVALPLARSVAAGRATLAVTATDGSGNRKVLTRIISVPARTV